MAPKSQSKFVQFMHRNQFMIWVNVVFFLVPMLLVLTNQFVGLFDVVIFDHWMGNARVCAAILLGFGMAAWAFLTFR